LGGPAGRAPAHDALSSPQISQAHRSRGRDDAQCRLPRRSIVLLPAAASRSLPAVASLRDGFANLDPASTRQDPAAARKMAGTRPPAIPVL